MAKTGNQTTVENSSSSPESGSGNTSTTRESEQERALQILNDAIVLARNAGIEIAMNNWPDMKAPASYFCIIGTKIKDNRLVLAK